jgi:hypothetical protein
MEIGRGAAFELNPEVEVGPGRKAIPVIKRWTKQDGRDLLMEEVWVPELSAEIDKLPKQSSIVPLKRRSLMAGIPLPDRLKGSVQRKPLLMAQAKAETPGFVLDYVLLNTSLTNYTFKADTTYYINGTVNLYQTTTFEGGAVIKFNPASPSGLAQQGGIIQTLTGPYRPVVFTSRDDNSVGETISGSTGTPTRRTDDNYYLRIYSVAPAQLAHLRFAYDSCPLTVHAANVTFNDVQILHSTWPVYLNYGSTVWLNNFLAYDCPGETFWLVNSSTTHVAQATLSQCGPLWYQSGSMLSLTNSLLVNIGSINTSGLTTNCVAVTSGSSVFQSALGGLHYLPTNSSYRNLGTTNLSTGLLARLTQTTTEAPVVFTNQSFTEPTNYLVRALRDTNAPDLGYHYAPLDYVFGGCHFYTNITFNAGVAVGWFRTSSGWYHAGHGIHLDDRQSAIFNGTMEAPTWFVRANTVQERDRTAGYGPGGITGWASQYAQDVTRSPKVMATFTRFSQLANESGGHMRDDWGYLTLHATHSEFWSGFVAGYGTSAYLTNCLFFRCGTGMVEAWAGNAIAARNCTWKGQYQNVLNSIPYSVKDSVFDGTSIISPTTGDHGNNAYLTGANQLSPAGNNNIVVSNFNWQAGPLGNFYHGSSALTDKGERQAHAVGLHLFTTQVGQTPELGTAVDLGYHYVRAGANGPLDRDGDGIPDYRDTDADNDGMLDVTEILAGRHPLAAGVISDTGGGVGLKVFTRSN